MYDRWDDTYNSVLIQELLSRTPFAGGLSLSPEELMDYRTGAWYFASREPRNISIAINNSQTPQEKEELRKKYEELNSQGFLPESYMKQKKLSPSGISSLRTTTMTILLQW